MKGKGVRYSDLTGIFFIMFMVLHLDLLIFIRRGLALFVPIIEIIFKGGFKGRNEIGMRFRLCRQFQTDILPQKVIQEHGRRMSTNCDSLAC